MLGLLRCRHAWQGDRTFFLCWFDDLIAEDHEFIANSNLLSVGDDRALDDRRIIVFFALQLFEGAIAFLLSG